MQQISCNFSTRPLYFKYFFCRILQSWLEPYKKVAKIKRTKIVNLACSIGIRRRHCQINWQVQSFGKKMQTCIFFLLPVFLSLLWYFCILCDSVFLFFWLRAVFWILQNQQRQQLLFNSNITAYTFLCKFLFNFFCFENFCNVLNFGLFYTSANSCAKIHHIRLST